MARALLGLARNVGRRTTSRLAWPNGLPAVLSFEGEVLGTATMLDLDGDRIGAVYLVPNPDKLRRASSAWSAREWMEHSLRTLASRVLAAVVWCATIALPARGQEPARPLARDTTAQRDSIAPILPDTLKTPGAVLPVTREDICVPGYAKKIRNVPAAVKRRVYASYGITHREPGEYEVDHLITDLPRAAKRRAARRGKP